MFASRRTLLSLAMFCAPAVFAANQCVNPGGTGGCKASINAAIAAAGGNDTVTVAHGVYAENVIVNKPIALIGDSSQNTIINALGLANGINIDGRGNQGLSHVVVSGFTVDAFELQEIVDLRHLVAPLVLDSGRTQGIAARDRRRFPVKQRP